jgi:hypothetical protein
MRSCGPLSVQSGQGTLAGTRGNGRDAPENEPARAAGSTGRGPRIVDGEVASSVTSIKSNAAPARHRFYPHLATLPEDQNLLSICLSESSCSMAC